MNEVALVCNRCKNTLALDPSSLGFPLVASDGQMVGAHGWIEFDSVNHLCGECAPEYRALQAQQVEALADFAGLTAGDGVPSPAVPEDPAEEVESGALADGDGSMSDTDGV